MRAIRLIETRSNHHMTAGLLENFQQARNVCGIVLSVAIHSDDVRITELKRQLVSSLNAAAQSEMMRQPQHAGARGFRYVVGAIAGCIVYNKDGRIRYHSAHLIDDTGNRAGFIEGRDENQEIVRTASSSHSAATWR